jgi:hypothetical protein
LDFIIGDKVFYLGLGDKYKAEVLYIAEEKDSDGDEILINLMEEDRTHYIMTRKEKLEKRRM